MQRVRMSLPYFKEFGWEPEVVAVHPKHANISKDDLLLQSVPPEVPIHYVDALPKKWTSKVGLGSIALRSLPYYRSAVNRLLKANQYHLIYFSTTQFAVCILGRYWKRKFGVPYVIDMQDPWRSDYYLTRPKAERPPKFWFSYRLDKWLEQVAMNKVDGLIAVSQSYTNTLARRYTHCQGIPKRTITFGYSPLDFEIARSNKDKFSLRHQKKANNFNVVYIGRGGADMHQAVRLLFKALKEGLAKGEAAFAHLRFHFLGTSYAANGEGKPSILPIAKEFEVEEYVSERTDRLPFYEALYNLSEADALFVPGSTDPQYSASKVYPYLMLGKPMLALFHPDSNVVGVLKRSEACIVCTFDEDESRIISSIQSFLKNLSEGLLPDEEPEPDLAEEISAKTKTAEQCALFSEVLKSRSVQ